MLKFNIKKLKTEQKKGGLKPPFSRLKNLRLE